MIEVDRVSKHFRVHERKQGFLPALKGFLFRSYRNIKAIEDISFTIGEGEIVGFLGPNGAGKTTMMKMLSGLLVPTSGSLKVAGYTPHEHKNAYKRRISLVMGQKSQLLWDIPALETFAIHREIYDISDSQYRQVLLELDDLLDIGGIINKPVRQLSLGERMKCELVAALLHRPEILFLDEPTIGLDVGMQEAVRRFISEYNRAYKATVLLTSHYMADVSALCERVMIINHGSMLYDGNIHRLIDRYAPYRYLRLKLDVNAHHASIIGMLTDQVISPSRVSLFDFPNLELEVPREHVSLVSSRILKELPVVDLTIEEPSLESVISQAFEHTQSYGIPSTLLKGSWG